MSDLSERALTILSLKPLYHCSVYDNIYQWQCTKVDVCNVLWEDDREVLSWIEEKLAIWPW